MKRRIKNKIKLTNDRKVGDRKREIERGGRARARERERESKEREANRKGVR